MKGKTVFIDIDGTITHDTSGNSEVGYFEYALRNLLERKYHLTVSEALKKVLKAEEKVIGKDPFLALSYLDFNVSKEELWREILKVQKKVLKVYSDAVYFVRGLYEMGYNLYIVSNNTTNRALAKLIRAGLANLKGSKYFKKIYGYDFTSCQKNSPDFYRKVLNDREFNIESIVMVGDDSVCDMEIPKEAGIKNFIIVNRKQKKNILKRDGAYFVNNLILMLKILKR